MKRLSFVIILVAFSIINTAAKPKSAGLPVVKTGIEVLRTQGFKPLEGKRVGLVTNPSGVDSRLVSTIDILFEAPEVKLVALFGPEHGVRGEVYAGGGAAWIN